MRLNRAARRSASAALAVVALLCVLTSCGTSSPESQPSPPATTAAATTAAPTTDATAACEDVEALKSSLEALTKVRPADDGLTALTTAIANVKTSLDKAEASASPVLQPSVQQVKTAFGELQTAASGLTADNLRQKAPAIASAIKEVATATQALSTKVNESCPGN
jgi:phage-related protein